MDRVVPSMDERQVALFVRSLSGSTLKVLFMMFFIGPGTGPSDLALKTGLSERTVERSLADLEYYGLAQRHRRYNGWSLTGQARQMMLQMQGIQEPALVEAEATQIDPLDQATEAESESESNSDSDDSEGKCTPRDTQNLRLGSSSSYRSSSVSRQKLKTTTTDSGDAKNLRFDEDAEAAVQTLKKLGVPERTRNGKGARDAVGAAMSGGWTGERIFNAVRGWVAYARTPAGSSITHPGFFTVARLAACQEPPEPERKMEVQRSRDDVARDYISAAYERIVRR